MTDSVTPPRRPSMATGVIRAVRATPRSQPVSAAMAAVGIMFGAAVVALVLVHELLHGGSAPSAGELILWGGLAVLAALLITGERVGDLGDIIGRARGHHDDE